MELHGNKTWLAFLCFAVTTLLVSGQSDYLCPSNNRMGLCQEVTNPCYTDTDCSTDEICCPEACSRVCKPKMAANKNSAALSEVPDLLNDPRVYVGKCPDASCYDMFNMQADQCSTSNLCRPEQTCCHDGCKNVCQWKPKYAKMIAQYEARVRLQKQMIYQKQQAELKKRQEEEYRKQRKRQEQAYRMQQAKMAELKKQQVEAYRLQQAKMAELEQARKAAKARAEAEAVLASQKAQQQAMAMLQQKQQFAAQSAAQNRPQNSLHNFLAPPVPVTNAYNTNSNNMGSPGSQQYRSLRTENTIPNGFFNALKKSGNAGVLTNQIESPANVNPYTLSRYNNINKVGRSSTINNFASNNKNDNALVSALARLITSPAKTNAYNQPSAGYRSPSMQQARPASVSATAYSSNPNPYNRNYNTQQSAPQMYQRYPRTG